MQKENLMPTPEYLSNLETLVKARTEQLRTSLKNHELMRQALESVTKAESLEQAKKIAQEVQAGLQPIK